MTMKNLKCKIKNCRQENLRGDVFAFLIFNF